MSDKNLQLNTVWYLYQSPVVLNQAHNEGQQFISSALLWATS
jgi:hypothetical protein